MVGTVSWYRLVLVDDDQDRSRFLHSGKSVYEIEQADGSLFTGTLMQRPVRRGRPLHKKLIQ